KVSNPGLQRVKRYSQNGEFTYDLIYDELKGVSDMAINLRTAMTEYPEGECEDILIDVFKDGKQVYELPSLNETREYCQEQLHKLNPRVKATIFPEFYKVCIEDSLNEVKRELMQSK
ncbi:MAG: hypothetical protein NE327_13925, partial [Lentisphaeraceae bacterium]|nr:hypothetical protein [Lentisphaeraceae bacterium]